MTCPKCKRGHSVKTGNHHGRQRYKRKECGYQYTGTGDKNAAIRAGALYLYICGLSMRAIARMFSAPPPTVLYWALNFTLTAYEKPVQQGAVELSKAAVIGVRFFRR
ncbi:MAG: hypothetical protein Pg6C_16200 [Treponemataceae bacterium]|nr:MAG: hypothetical protein Pg6C_16200 [Treponemataceae bacterium]